MPFAQCALTITGVRHAKLLAYATVTAALVLQAACTHSDAVKQPVSDQHATRAQLSIGYSLLFQEADGISKLKWILMFKDKPEEMGRVTNDVIRYYRELADSMQTLSKQIPAMRIDVAPMSVIEGKARKAMGEDLAKDFAPVVGKTDVAFEREALLTFYDGLNEQRHLAKVMLGLETDPALKRFLETTRVQLDTRYAEVGALLNRRYFAH